MQEIRFRHSEEVAEQYLKGLFESGLMVIDRCDTCGDVKRGLFSVTTGTFTCYKCLVEKRFEELVGKPLDI